MTTVTRRYGVGSILIIIAIICFILAGLGVDAIKGLSLGWFGLAFFAGGHLVD